MAHVPLSSTHEVFMVGPQKKHRTERGEAEMLFFITVVVIAAVISGAMWTFGWVRETKDARVERIDRARIDRNKPAPFVVRTDPGEYYITCQKPLWSLLSKELPCEILEESYRELELRP